MVNEKILKVALITATLLMVTTTVTTCVTLFPLTQHRRSPAPVLTTVAVADGYSKATSTEFSTGMSAASFVVQDSGGRLHARDEPGEK